MKIYSISGHLIYDSNSDITIKECLLEAIKKDIDLSGADLRRADLCGADLSGADLRCANLRGADLYGAELRRAKLRRADLSGADLRCANLRDVCLYGADLCDVCLCDADLYGANLSGADLSGADLYDADLRNANLSGADLSGADLRNANLSGANLSGAKNKELAYVPLFCKWTLSIIKDKIKVGCKEKTPGEWIEWLNSHEEYETKRGTEQFKQIEACIRAYITYYEFLNK